MSPTALSASTLTGDKVRNHEGAKLGHLEEIVIDLETGRVAYAVLASGGFLGLGDKYFAIPWDMVTVDTDSREVIIDVDKKLLETAPGFDKDNWPDVFDRGWISDVYRYYGAVPYWDTADGDMEAAGRHVVEDDMVLEREDMDDIDLEDEEYEELEDEDEDFKRDLPERVD